MHFCKFYLDPQTRNSRIDDADQEKYQTMKQILNSELVVQKRKTSFRISIVFYYQGVGRDYK